MIQLYCPDLKSYIRTKDASYNFECESQFQSLEGYNVLYSFEIEVVSDSTIKSILDRNLQILMVVNGSPLYIGKANLLETNESSVTICLQMLPYGECFKNFALREKLEDYFFPEIPLGDGSFGTLEYVFGSELDQVDLYAVNGYHCKAYKLNQYIPDPIIFSSNRILTSFVTDNESQIGIPTPNNWVDDCLAIRTDDMLKCLGINHWINKGDIQPYLVCEKAVKVKYLLKVRLLHDAYSPGKYHINYSPKISKYSKIEIQLTNLDTEWDNNQPSYDATNYFLGSIWIGKVPFNCSCNRIDVIYRSDSEEMVSNNGQPIEYLSELGETFFKKTWSVENKDYVRGEDLKYEFPVKPITSTIGTSPFAIDLYLKIDDVITRAIYQANPVFFRTSIYPLNGILALQQSTGDFLNEASLNSKSWSFLRNPLYVNEKNWKNVYGFDTKPNFVFNCNDNQIISMRKEINTDTEKEIVVTAENGNYNPYVYKALNDKLTDPKKVVQSNLSTLIRLSYDTAYNVLPYHSKFDKGYVSRNINFVFAQADTAIEADIMPITYIKYYEWKEDSMQYDYIDRYVDHSEKYIMECYCYQFQEYVNLNEGNVRFAVGKYSTEDFIKFTIEMYKLI